MTKITFKLSALLCALSFWTGCVTRGSDFPSDMAWIKKNQTTVQDIKQVLGEPYMVGNSSGTVTWTYGYYKYRLIGESHTKELKFYFAPDKKVDSFAFQSSFPVDKKSAF